MDNSAWRQDIGKGGPWCRNYMSGAISEPFASVLLEAEHSGVRQSNDTVVC